jgi:nitroreductase
MINRQILNKILEAGIRAPSGDNSQPWRIKIHQNSVSIYCMVDADESYYDYKQRGSFIAHGALVESIIIAAETLGYKVIVREFPKKEEPYLTAILDFKPSVRKRHYLYNAIFERTTNRRKYRDIPLSESHKKMLLDITREYPNYKLILIEDRKDKEKVSEALSFTDRFFLEDKHTHRILFNKIRFIKDDHVLSRTGMHINTLELIPPEKVAIRLFSKWKILKIFNIFGISKMLPKNTARLYNTSSAIAVAVMPGKRSIDFFNAGRYIQRLWLTATESGMAFAPITALPYLASMIEENKKNLISRKHVEDALKADKIIKQTAGIKNNNTIVMTFRLGYADKPTSYSNRLPLEEVLLH